MLRQIGEFVGGEEILVRRDARRALPGHGEIGVGVEIARLNAALA
jgi:hypothetical protein